MPGANYMGGRINAVKARVRDSEGRLKKGHFGKQRLAILSTGLASSGAHGRAVPGTRESAISQIGLAHARRGSHTDVGYFDENIPGKASGNAYTNDILTPPPKRRRIDRGKKPPSGSSAGTSAQSRRKKSRVLQELDRTEPFCMRAEIDRLLSMPDFAGLWRQAAASQGLSSGSASPQSQRSITLEVERQHTPLLLSSQDDRDSNRDFHRGPRSLASPFSPPRRIDVPERNINQHNPFSFQCDSRVMSSPTTTIEVGHGSSSGRPISPDQVEDGEPPPTTPYSYLESDETVVSSPVLQPPLENLIGSSDSTAYSYSGRSRISTGNENGSAALDSEDKYTRSLQEFVDAQYREDWSIEEEPLFRMRSPPMRAHVRHTTASSGISADIQDQAHQHETKTEMETAARPTTRSPSACSDPHCDSATKIKLIDAVNGQLFENSDPWRTILSRLGLCSNTSATTTLGLGPSTTHACDTFLELALSQDRSGVGYSPPIPLATARGSSPTDGHYDEDAGMEYEGASIEAATEITLDHAPTRSEDECQLSAVERSPFLHNTRSSPDHDVGDSTPLQERLPSPLPKPEAQDMPPVCSDSLEAGGDPSISQNTILSMSVSPSRGSPSEDWKQEISGLYAESYSPTEAKTDMIVGPMLFSDEDEDTEA